MNNNQRVIGGLAQEQNSGLTREINLITEENNQGADAPNNPKLRIQHFVRVQLKVVYAYMERVSHENRYRCERLLHIMWILAMLAMCQFHLLHISSFSYNKCMSGQIVKTLEDFSRNATSLVSELQLPANVTKLDELSKFRKQLWSAHPGRWQPVSRLDLERQWALTQLQRQCPKDREMDFLVQDYFTKDLKLQNLISCMSKHKSQFENCSQAWSKQKARMSSADHNSFKKLFTETTDLFLLRIVDQTAQVNLETDATSKEFKRNAILELATHSDSENTIIQSRDKQDIIKAVNMLNDSYVHQAKHFYKLVEQEFAKNSADGLWLKLFKLFKNLLSGKLMNDNIYAFTYDEQLLSLTADQLAKTDARILYLQVSSLNKCVPQDWFLGYDAFAVYTFRKLASHFSSNQCSMKAFFRPSKKNNFLRDYFSKNLQLDYHLDFEGDLYQENSNFFLAYCAMRLKQIGKTLFQLGLCVGISYAIVLFSKVILFETQLNPNHTISKKNKVLIGIFSSVFLVSPICFEFRKYPFSTSLIAYTIFIAQAFSVVVLEHTKYQFKYRFWMFIGTFLNYFYLVSYPFCNVTLTNIVYITFTLYQILHNLFKFGYQMEMTLEKLQTQGIRSVLSPSILTELNRRQDQRHQQQQQAERVQREDERMNDVRAQFEINRRERLRQLEENLRETAMESNSNPRVVEEQVRQQMAMVRDTMNSPQYQRILEAFGNVMHRPSQVADTNTRNNNQQPNVEGYINQYQSYQGEVNRQISQISGMLTDIQSKVTEGLRKEIPEESKSARAPQRNIGQTSLSTKQPEVMPELVNDPYSVPNEPTLPRFQLGDQWHRPDQATGKQQLVQGGQYHNLTSKEKRRQNRKEMMDFPSMIDRTVEQQDCVTCACINCHKLFFAQVRHMQDDASRRKALDEMEEQDMDVQLRMLLKQFNMIMEVLGSEFILSRSTRGRKYEDKYGRGSTKYTNRLKNIDDMNELCDILKLSMNEMQRQRRDPVSSRRLDNNLSKQQELLRKLSDPNYKCRTIDDVYAVHQRIQDEMLKQSQQAESSQKTAVTSMGNKLSSDFEQLIREQDWLPVMQVLIVDLTNQSDSAYVKEKLNYRNALDPKFSYSKGDIRFCHQNPTYILRFKPGIQHNDQMYNFIGVKLRILAVNSIWRDPKKFFTDPVEISQLNQYINLQLKLEYKINSDKIVQIERLCMMPPLKDKQKYTKELGQTVLYGQDKDIDTQIVKVNLSENQKDPLIKVTEITQVSSTGNQKEARSSIPLVMTTSSSFQQQQVARQSSSQVEEVKLSNDQISASKSQATKREVAAGPKALPNLDINQITQQLQGIEDIKISQQEEGAITFTIPIQNKQKNAAKTKKNAAKKEEKKIKDEKNSEEMKRILEYFEHKVQDMIDTSMQAQSMSLQDLMDSLRDDQPNTSSQQSQPISRNEIIDYSNINQELLLLQNQIEQAAYLIRNEDENGNQVPVTAEHIRNNPGKERQIASFQNMFFNDESVNVSCFQAVNLNIDEKKFLKQILDNYQDIIALFPALHQMQSQILVMKLLDKRDQLQNCTQEYQRMQQELGREFSLAQAVMSNMLQQNKTPTKSAKGSKSKKSSKGQH